MKNKLIVLSFLLIGSLSLFSQGAQTYEYDLVASLFDPCTGEDVIIEGEVHGVFYETYNANTGKYHLQIHENLSGNGTGVDSGAKYKYNTAWHYNDNLLPGQTYTEGFTLLLNGQGSVPNAKLKALRHFTVNANGELTSTIGNFEIICQ